jgi:hypothetical protein
MRVETPERDSASWFWRTAIWHFRSLISETCSAIVARRSAASDRATKVSARAAMVLLRLFLGFLLEQEDEEPTTLMDCKSSSVLLMK